MSEFEKKVDAFEKAQRMYSSGAYSQDDFAALREKRDAAKQALLDEHARVAAVCHESNAVCVCGCPTADHENYGDDGESCGNEAHQCIRTSRAVLEMLTDATKERDELKAAIRTQPQCVSASDQYYGVCSWCDGGTCTENCIWTRCQSEEPK